MPLGQFKKLIDNLRSFDFEKEQQEIVADNAEAITPYVLEQLAAGKDGDGKENTIFGRRGYSPKTVAIKEANGEGLGRVTSRITNYMTGEFYETMFAKVEGKTFEEDSPVSYFGDITLYSSDALLEVNEENRKDFGQKIILPGITDRLLAKTGLLITSK